MKKNDPNSLSQREMGLLRSEASSAGGDDNTNDFIDDDLMT